MGMANEMLMDPGPSLVPSHPVNAGLDQDLGFFVAFRVQFPVEVKPALIKTFRVIGRT